MQKIEKFSSDFHFVNFGRCFFSAPEIFSGFFDTEFLVSNLPSFSYSAIFEKENEKQRAA